jgi:hypothetical protein
MNGRKDSRGVATREDVVALAARTGDRRGMDLVAHHEYGHVGYAAPWNESGRVVVLRFAHPTEKGESGKPRKALTQAHRGDDGLWRLGLPSPDPAKGAQGRPLYRLGEVIAARESGVGLLLVLEGEKSVDAAWSIGIPATCVLGGSNAPALSDWAPIASPSWIVAIAGSEDAPGRKYENAVAHRVLDDGAEARVVRLPGLRPDSGDDLVEFIAARRAEGRRDGEIREEIERLATSAPKYEPATAPATAPAKKSKGRRRKSLVEVLGDPDDSRCELFHDRDGEGYATMLVGDHVETHAIRSRSFRKWLGRVAFETGVSGSRYTIDEAVEQLAAHAAYDPASTEREVHRRWAWHGGVLFYDLADPTWRVVEARADANGTSSVRILPALECPVRFVRANGAMPQVAPIDGGSIDELRPLVNLTDESWTILPGYLPSVFLPKGELPALEVSGPENSGKSWITSLVLDLTDPTLAAECAMPREVRDLYVRAKYRRVLALGNVSSLSPEISDALCRITTGTGVEERSYYTTQDLDTFAAQSAVVLNGIGRHVTRSDLASRKVDVETVEIPRERQREREELLALWAAVRPRVFGALLRAVAMAYARRDQIVLREKPRLADAARFVEAAAPGLGLAPGEWTRAVLGQLDAGARELVEDSPIARAVRDLAVQRGPWVGSAADLLAALEAATDPRVRGDYWPRSARGLAGVLMRFARALRDLGVVVEADPRTDHSKLKQWTVRFSKLPVRCAEQAGEAARHGDVRGESAANHDAPRPADVRPATGRSDAPEASRDAPRQAAPVPGNGANGASGASIPPRVEADEVAFDLDEPREPVS